MSGQAETHLSVAPSTLPTRSYVFTALPRSNRRSHQPPWAVSADSIAEDTAGIKPANLTNLATKVSPSL
jgi:hypothetical protein